MDNRKTKKSFFQFMLFLSVLPVAFIFINPGNIIGINFKPLFHKAVMPEKLSQATVKFYAAGSVKSYVEKTDNTIYLINRSDWTEAVILFDNPVNLISNMLSFTIKGEKENSSIFLGVVDSKRRTVPRGKFTEIPYSDMSEKIVLGKDDISLKNIDLSAISALKFYMKEKDTVTVKNIELNKIKEIFTFNVK